MTSSLLSFRNLPVRVARSMLISSPQGRRISPSPVGTITCPGVGNGDFEGNEAAGVFYHDISGTYQYKNVNLTIGVDNLFDKDPPYVGGALNANSLGSAGYDFTGRLIYMKTSIKF